MKNPTIIAGLLVSLLCLNFKDMANVILLSPFTPVDGKNYKIAIAQCRCGGQYEIRDTLYNRGRSSTCGCAAKQDKHGYHSTILYQRWESMKQRCYYPKHASYKNYGGRGITVCYQWQKFIAFKEWAEANGYDESLELDRKRNDRGYYPLNCRWVTHSFNNRNTRRNHLITSNGVTKTLTEWSEISGLCVGTIKKRIYKRNISPETFLHA